MDFKRAALKSLTGAWLYDDIYICLGGNTSSANLPNKTLAFTFFGGTMCSIVLYADCFPFK